MAVLNHEHYISLATYPAEEILSLVGRKVTSKFIVNDITYKVNLCSARLHMFKNSQVCVKCGRVGTIMSLDKLQNDVSAHFNLYCKEGDNLILMTKDHIVPKSKGGVNHTDNYQTMCSDCNYKKADNVTDEVVKEIEIKISKNYKKEKDQALDMETKLEKIVKILWTKNVFKYEDKIVLIDRYDDLKVYYKTYEETKWWFIKRVKTIETLVCHIYRSSVGGRTPTSKVAAFREGNIWIDHIDNLYKKACLKSIEDKKLEECKMQENMDSFFAPID